MEVVVVQEEEEEVKTEEPLYCPQAVVDLFNHQPRAPNLHNLRSKARSHLLALGWKFWKGVKGARLELRYTSPSTKTYYSLRTACKGCIDEQGLSQLPTPHCHLTQASTKQKRKRAAPRRKEYSLDGGSDDEDDTTTSSRSNKRVRRVVASNPEHYTPRTVLSWLIDNNVVLPRAKVYYKSRNSRGDVLAQGKLTRDGIKCNCCQNVFGMTGFEVHAAGTTSYHSPAARSIFLEDGRSLLDCQKQMAGESQVKGFPSSEHCKRIKTSRLSTENDDICSVCHYGGTLLMCDQCPSSFHLNCLGLDSLPEGDWFCQACRCAFCGQSEFNENIDQFTEKTVLYCDQCEREYHVGCLKERGVSNLECCPEGNWFCSQVCENIFTGLHELVGKSIEVGIDNLSGSLLKFSKDEVDAESMSEYYSKLSVALAVMHECFEPIKEAQTKDLVKDLLFNKTAELKRLDFRGFYTVLLEKGDELVSVAVFRVHGEKVAEVPLVATRVQYRRQGMCSILMDLLEKKLAEFGVEKLILPAVPQVLHAWTTSFGFSKMTDSERLEFLEYIFLDFQGTTMCQKNLKMAPPQCLKYYYRRRKDTQQQQQQQSCLNLQ